MIPLLSPKFYPVMERVSSTQLNKTDIWGLSLIPSSPIIPYIQSSTKLSQFYPLRIS